MWIWSQAAWSCSHGSSALALVELVLVIPLRGDSLIQVQRMGDEPGDRPRVAPKEEHDSISRTCQGSGCPFTLHICTCCWCGIIFHNINENPPPTPLCSSQTAALLTSGQPGAAEKQRQHFCVSRTKTLGLREPGL